MKVTFTHPELIDLCRGTLLARGFSPTEANEFAGRVICNHKKGTISLVLDNGGPRSVVAEDQPLETT